MPAGACPHLADQTIARLKGADELEVGADGERPEPRLAEMASFLALPRCTGARSHPRARLGADRPTPCEVVRTSRRWWRSWRIASSRLTLYEAYG